MGCVGYRYFYNICHNSGKPLVFALVKHGFYISKGSRIIYESCAQMFSHLSIYGYGVEMSKHVTNIEKNTRE